MQLVLAQWLPKHFEQSRLLLALSLPKCYAQSQAAAAAVAVAAAAADAVAYFTFHRRRLHRDETLPPHNLDLE